MSASRDRSVYARLAGDPGDGRQYMTGLRLSEVPGMVIARTRYRASVNLEVREGERGEWKRFRVDVLADEPGCFTSFRSTPVPS